MDEASNKVHTSLPANYVTLVDLRERWMQQQKQKKGDEEIRGKELDRNYKVQGEDVGDGNQLDKKIQAPENSRLQSNPNPRPSNRRPSHGNRRPIESRSCHWIQVSQPNPPTEFPRNRTERASIVQSKQLKPPPPPVVQKIGAKEAPTNRIIQSKHPLLDSPKVESCGEIHSSGKVAQKKTPRRNSKINGEKKVMDQSPPEKCAEENPKQGLEAGKVNKNAGHKTGADKIAHKKKPSRNNKRNDEKKDVDQSPPEKCAKENPEQGFEAGKVNKDADDNTGAEIVGRIVGVSLSSRTWEKSGCKSMAVRYQRPLRKEKVGGYGKFEGRFMLNKDRARSENGLVWVKKGEAP